MVGALAVGACARPMNAAGPAASTSGGAAAGTRIAALCVSPCSTVVKAACWDPDKDVAEKYFQHAGPREPLGGRVINCEPWNLGDLKGPDGRVPPPNHGGVSVPIVLHLMRADHVNPSPVDELWDEKAIRTYFGPNGWVNLVWRDKGIRFAVRRVERCDYTADDLRLDRVRRDAIPSPEGRVPWAPQLFRSITELFTEREIQKGQPAVHVLLWASLGDELLDSIAHGDTGIAGYARAAGRGGPAAWIDTTDCLEEEGAFGGTAPRCARLIAHELGHALRLHHVQEKEVPAGDTNLMSRYFDGCDLRPWQRAKAVEEAETRFGPK